jgi:hypothetical protein
MDLLKFEALKGTKSVTIQERFWHDKEAGSRIHYAKDGAEFWKLEINRSLVANGANDKCSGRLSPFTSEYLHTFPLVMRINEVCCVMSFLCSMCNWHFGKATGTH